MKTLYIFPTSFADANSACPIWSKNTDKLNLSVLTDYLSNNYQLFDRVIISGGNFHSLSPSYQKDLFSILNRWCPNIILECLPTNDINHISENVRLSYLFNFDVSHPKHQWFLGNMVQSNGGYDISTYVNNNVISHGANNILRFAGTLPYLQNISFKHLPHKIVDASSEYMVRRERFYRDINRTPLRLPITITNPSQKNNMEFSTYMLTSGKIV